VASGRAPGSCVGRGWIEKTRWRPRPSQKHKMEERGEMQQKKGVFEKSARKRVSKKKTNGSTNQDRAVNVVNQEVGGLKALQRGGQSPGLIP